MKIFISSFIVVTDEAIDFINTCKEEGTDYLLVMTDGGNPVFSAEAREDWLINSSGYRDLNIETILHNEDLVDFVDAIKEIEEKLEVTDTTFESFYLPEDIVDIVPLFRDNVKVLNGLNGELLINHKEYLDKANSKWKARFGNKFVDIITSSQYAKESEDFGFILVTDVETDVDGKESTNTYISLAYDYDRKEFFAPSTNVESFDNIPLFISILEDQFNLEIEDYHFRTFVEKGVSNRMVFLEVAKNSDSLQTLFGDHQFEVNKYSDLVSIIKSQAYTAGGIGSWASLMVDDIKREAEYNE